MKKAIYVASVMIHFKSFHLPFLKMLKDDGYETTLIASDDMDLPYCDKKYQAAIERNPLKTNNIKAYSKLKKIFNEEKPDIIHCHTPVAAFLTRLAARKARKGGTKVYYTAHGFHFFKGAPKLNWLIYFPVEWISSFFTDVLITINKEDYAFAKTHLHAKETRYIPGIGLDTEKIFSVNIDRAEKRREIGLSENDFAILSVGELNDNKNHETVLKAISKLNDKSVKYVICGKGDKEEYLRELAKSLNMEERLILLGYRTDIPQILKACDLFAFPSKREGLPVSVIEAMSSGLFVVGSKIRGNTDLIKEGKSGFLCNPQSSDEFAEKIKLVTLNKDMYKGLGENNTKAVEKFDVKNIEREMKSIYGIN